MASHNSGRLCDLLGVESVVYMSGRQERLLFTYKDNNVVGVAAPRLVAAGPTHVATREHCYFTTAPELQQLLPPQLRTHELQVSKRTGNNDRDGNLFNLLM